MPCWTNNNVFTSFKCSTGTPSHTRTHFISANREECNLFTVGLLHDFMSRSMEHMWWYFYSIAVFVGKRSDATYGVLRISSKELCAHKTTDYIHWIIPNFFYIHFYSFCRLSKLNVLLYKKSGSRIIKRQWFAIVEVKKKWRRERVLVWRIKLLANKIIPTTQSDWLEHSIASTLAHTNRRGVTHSSRGAMNTDVTFGSLNGGFDMIFRMNFGCIIFYIGCTQFFSTFCSLLHKMSTKSFVTQHSYLLMGRSMVKFIVKRQRKFTTWYTLAFLF